MTKLSPQCETIFNHLLRGGTLSALEAVQQPFGTTCLAKRISEIEATGVMIDKTWETNGKKRWYRYSFHKKLSEDMAYQPGTLTITSHEVPA